MSGITILGLDVGISNVKSVTKLIDSKSHDIVEQAALEIEAEAKTNLSGRVLGIVSGNLISGTHANTTQKTIKGYENTVTSTAVSETGDHYGVYWELEGGRPFLNPAVQASIVKIEQKSVLAVYSGVLNK